MKASFDVPIQTNITTVWRPTPGRWFRRPASRWGDAPAHPWDRLRRHLRTFI